jgi:hypothetical protein
MSVIALLVAYGIPKAFALHGRLICINIGLYFYLEFWNCELLRYLVGQDTASVGLACVQICRQYSRSFWSLRLIG